VDQIGAVVLLIPEKQEIAHINVEAKAVVEL
jgi:hypothetical protein